MGHYTGVLGLIAILAFAWLCSTAKHAIKLRVVLWGLGLQFAFAIIVLRRLPATCCRPSARASRQCSGTPRPQHLCIRIARHVHAAGRFRLRVPSADHHHFHRVVLCHPLLPGHHAVPGEGMAVAMQKIMGVSGAEALNVAASIFMAKRKRPSPSSRFWRA